MKGIYILMKKDRLSIIFCTLILIFFGILMVYSSSYVWADYKFGNKYHYFIYQLIFLFVSFIILKIVLKFDLNYVKKNINIYLFIGIVLLILVAIPGIGVVRNGSRSWFSIGPVGFQPSELIKILLIIFTAKYLEKYHMKINKIKDNVLPLFILLFIITVLIMLEPDFGSSMIIILTILSMLFISGLKYSFFKILSIIGLVLISIIIIIAPYRLARIVSFINPWKDPLGSGYQIIQSLYAIGPGGLFGHGLFSSRQKFFYLPEPQTDFIFAVLCEELGFITSTFVIIIFIYLFYKIFVISNKNKDIFKKFLGFGIGSSFVIQTLMNLCVVVGLIPVTGVTLPFFSYGGSSLLVSIISIGIILNIAKNN